MSTDIDDAAVVRFLRDNPDFLARNPELYRHLMPPERSHGEALADHMASMLHRARQDATEARAKAESRLGTERAGADLAARVRVCVLALLAEDEIGEWVEHSLPGLLGIDAAGLRHEGEGLAAGSIAGLMGGAAVRLDAHPAPELRRALHGSASPLARHAAYVRVPRTIAGPVACVLALACRDREIAAAGSGAEALGFLGEAIGACLARLTRPRIRVVAGR